MRWEEHVARIRENSNTYRILMVKPKRKRSVGRPRRRCEYNIKMQYREVGWGVMD
jgi:hypothetical protein